MIKYYRIKKETLTWKEGAIISNAASNDMYKPIEDIWNKEAANGTEGTSSRLVEHQANSDYFERVYKDTIGGLLFRAADQMAQVYKDSFK